MTQKFEHNGSTFNGYLASPATPNGKGILFFHAWWGLNDFIRQTCDALAGEGYLVLAPDYYNGKVGTTIEEAEALTETVDWGNADTLIATAAGYLAAQLPGETPKMGTIGISLGGVFTVNAAIAYSRWIKAAVIYYGLGEGDFSKSKASFLGHLAAHDQFDDAETYQAFEQQIKDAKLETAFYTYPNTEHWFIETDRPEYRPGAAQLAWERTLEFLEAKLK